MTDGEGEGMGTNESITGELRSVTAERGVIRVEAHEPTVVISDSERDDIADRIYERFSRELTAKQDEVDALRAKLDASILPPVDADGMPWTEEDVDKPFASPDGSTTKILTEVTPTWRLDGWGLIDEDEVVYPADKCHHVAPEPPESIDDVRKAKDNAIAFLAQSGVMGWTDLNTFSGDFARVFDRAYACGRRDGAGELA